MKHRLYVQISKDIVWKQFSRKSLSTFKDNHRITSKHVDKYNSFISVECRWTPTNRIIMILHSFRQAMSKRCPAVCRPPRYAQTCYRPSSERLVRNLFTHLYATILYVWISCMIVLEEAQRSGRFDIACGMHNL